MIYYIRHCSCLQCIQDQTPKQGMVLLQPKSKKDTLQLGPLCQLRPCLSHRHNGLIANMGRCYAFFGVHRHFVVGENFWWWHESKQMFNCKAQLHDQHHLWWMSSNRGGGALNIPNASLYGVAWLSLTKEGWTIFFRFSVDQYINR